jgi:hypothetical protein
MLAMSTVGWIGIAGAVVVLALVIGVKIKQQYF